VNADFFFTADEAYGGDRVARLLKTYVDPEITLSTWGLDTLDWNVRHQVAQRYSQLLAASLPPEKALTIEVKELMWGERRVYVSVYWPVLVTEYGSYHYTYVGTNFFPANPGLGMFFPALAIHDRMVLVPIGQNQTLGQLGPVESEVPDLGARDVQEVDFRNPDDLEAEIRRAGQRIREEIWQNFRAYSSLSQGDMTSLPRVAADLGVSPTLLEDTIRKRTTDMAAAYADVTAAIEPTSIVQGRWHKLTLVLRRSSQHPLGAVVVNVSGPAQVLPSTSRADLGDAAEVRVALSVKSNDVGEFPLEVSFVPEGQPVLGTSIPPSYVWLTSVAEGAS
jgi:hypothetical protein